MRKQWVLICVMMWVTSVSAVQVTIGQSLCAPVIVAVGNLQDYTAALKSHPIYHDLRIMNQLLMNSGGLRQVARQVLELHPTFGSDARFDGLDLILLLKKKMQNATLDQMRAFQMFGNLLTAAHKVATYAESAGEDVGTEIDNFLISFFHTMGGEEFLEKLDLAVQKNPAPVDRTIVLPSDPLMPQMRLSAPRFSVEPLRPARLWARPKVNFVNSSDRLSLSFMTWLHQFERQYRDLRTEAHRIYNSLASMPDAEPAENRIVQNDYRTVIVESRLFTLERDTEQFLTRFYKLAESLSRQWRDPSNGPEEFAKIQMLAEHLLPLLADIELRPGAAHFEAPLWDVLRRSERFHRAEAIIQEILVVKVLR
jgi:hypothetical protein